ncbi:flagella basal body P-ring formation protein FlgA [Sphingomonas jatrophae]|uniref:Flagella basal body P-ring formation protein FlgA n=1 Tax=Sphingomonas jatrophae TaxID=1166337 RepID=A0A1I6MB53_9SPHN|nr:flagella basal body P-ring formation protein FlgA [Sphingomonas jatrophae]SFS12833.1 flagella basal body P-ring formation protein FlgA [Sphingomonas jatrophae]
MRLFLPVLLLAAPAAAAPFQNLAALETRLTGALGAGIGEVGGPAAPIDRRLKLAACPQPVSIEPPALGAVTLACPAIGWKLRVPLKRLAMTSAAGSPAMRAAPVIKRGDPVELVAERDGFVVSTQTVAQEDGVAGGRIRLRADAKAPVVIAEVVELGRARIP